MSLDASDLSPMRIAGGIVLAFVTAGAIPGPLLNKLSQDIAKAIVDELKNHAEVVVTMPPDGTGTIT